jgi:site-specific DNA-methyltransferase (adenine-specific)
VTAALLVDRPDVRVYHAAWDALHETIVEQGGHVNALITDCPYSAKTHAGHDGGAEQASAGMAFPDVRGNAKRYALGARAVRRALSYGAWAAEDVARFVEAWAPLVRGWFVSVTDDVLAPSWAAALEAQGRYVFTPLPFVAPGSRVRLSGDGPSGWTCWLVVARPRTPEFSRWGTLPGAYVLPPGYAERMPVVGGKPLWLMERLVEDYSRPGDLVCDPCMGAATTGVAALRVGRSFVGGDVLREHAELGARRLSQMIQRPLFVAGGE